jgi:hypothetical protein
MLVMKFWILRSNFQRKCKPNGVYADEENNDGNAAQTCDKDSVATDLSRTFMYTQSTTWFFGVKIHDVNRTLLNILNEGKVNCTVVYIGP